MVDIVAARIEDGLQRSSEGYLEMRQPTASWTVLLVILSLLAGAGMFHVVMTVAGIMIGVPIVDSFLALVAGLVVFWFVFTYDW